MKWSCSISHDQSTDFWVERLPSLIPVLGGVKSFFLNVRAVIKPHSLQEAEDLGEEQSGRSGFMYIESVSWTTR